MPMKPEVKAEWGEWLLEHENDQGSGALCKIRNDDGKEEFCCLGGLCELAVRAGIVTRTLSPGRTTYDYAAPGERPGSALLPRSVADWAGLGRIDPSVAPPGHGGRTITLSGLNDSGTTFREIWALIEAQL